jgi:hypothetical protein
MTEPKPTHRFVPTLTEVVQPPPGMHAPEPLPITPEVLEGIVDAALKRVEAGLTQKLPELMAVLLHEQAQVVKIGHVGSGVGCARRTMARTTRTARAWPSTT